MRNTLAIFVKELKSYFVSPMGYFVIAAFFCLNSLMFYIFISEPEWRSMGAMRLMRALLTNECFILLLVVPAMTMRLFAEERRSGTIEVLMTCPVRDGEVVLGKYIAALTLFGVMILISLVHPLILSRCSDPDWPTLLSGYLGLFLLGAAFISMGTLTSSLTRSQLIAALLCFCILLVLWIVGWIANLAQQPQIKELFKALSVLEPFDDFTKGVIAPENLFYYGSFIFYCLYLTVKSVQAKKWR